MTTPKVEVLPITEGATPDPNNVNKHTAKGGKLLDNSLRKRGAFRSIASAGKGVDTPVVYAGNYTLEKAVDVGFTEIINVHVTGNQLVNVVRDDLAPNSPEAIALGIEDNEIAKQSYNPDIDILAAIMADPMMQAIQAEDKILSEIVGSMGVKGESVDAEPQIDRAAELQEKWQTKTGQLWKLGDHRLLIGDCTVRENVEKLMGGEIGALFETDPPYGVDYVEKARYMDALGYAHSQAATQTDIEGDGGLDAVDLFKRTLYTWKPFIQKCAFYIWHSDRYRVEFEQLLKDLGVHVHETIIWVKPNFVISRMDYHPKHEPCLYGWIEAHKFSGERNQTTLWDIGRENDKIHPTQKPIEVFEIPIKNNTAIGEICIEPFAGSGSQIIAAHNLNRRCYAMEISEKYGAVILERFLTATNIEPELVK